MPTSSSHPFLTLPPAGLRRRYVRSRDTHTPVPAALCRNPPPFLARATFFNVPLSTSSSTAMGLELVKSPTWKLLSSFITGPVSDRRVARAPLPPPHSVFCDLTLRTPYQRFPSSNFFLPRPVFHSYHPSLADFLVPGGYRPRDLLGGPNRRSGIIFIQTTVDVKYISICI